MRIRVDYYTGTGGSERIAKRIAEEMRAKGAEASVHRIVRDHFVADDTFDTYLLVFAVHSFNAPAPVFEWVEQLTGRGRKCAVVSVSGAGEVISNTACRRKLIKRMERRGFEVTYEEMIRMPNNWMSVPSKEKCDRLLAAYPAKCAEIAQAIVEGKRRRTHPLWIDIALSKAGEAEKWGVQSFGRGIKTLESCTGCGLCAKQCCSSNITIIEKRAVVGDRCDMCLGCLYGCPHKALIATTAGFQVDKRGYDLREMERRGE